MISEHINRVTTTLPCKHEMKDGDANNKHQKIERSVQAKR